MTEDIDILEDPLADTKDKIRALTNIVTRQHAEKMGHLQNISEAVRQIRADQKKRTAWGITLLATVKKMVAYINTELHKLYLDDRDV